MRLIDKIERHLPTLVQTVKMIRNRQYEIMPPRRTFALGPLHEKIKKYCDFRGGTFFEVGANDGLSQSNTAYLEKYLGWKGILVEPIPHKYVECKLNRPNSHVFNVALVSDDYKKPLLEVTYANLMTTTELSDIDYDRQMYYGVQFLGAEIGISGEIFYAPARTAQSVIDQSGVKSVDFFSLDVEGAELEVLRGIDFSKIRPKLFLIELRDRESVENLLNDEGYELVETFSHHDYLFRDTRSAAGGAGQL